MPISYEKPLLYIVPIYIGSLKYYEKILTALQEHFTVRFLFVRSPDKRREQMIRYCEERGYQFDTIDAGVRRKGERGMPFVSAFVERYAYIRACRKLLLTQRPKKMIFVKNVTRMRPLFQEANYQGIETIVLQFGFSAPLGHYRNETRAWSFSPYALYSTMLPLLFFFSDFLMRGPRFALASIQPKKVGAIGEEGKYVLPERFGYPKERITVVGNADFERIATLQEELSTNVSKKKMLLEKYGLSEDKKIILIIGSWLSHYLQAQTSHTEEENKAQIAYYENLIKHIRNVFFPTEADILFKLHPAEENIYDSLKTLGVFLYGDQALVEELFLISDLYIADPCTSANYMVIASGKPALFVNLSPLTVLNKTAPFYRIKEVVASFGKLEEYLMRFKEGTLPLLYEATDVDRKSIKSIADFIIADLKSE